MALKHVQQTYDKLGRDDPLYAVLSFPDTEGNRWDPEVFFQRGRDEIRDALAHLQELGVQPLPGVALDFGCGVGRLTQALCEPFERAVGVDISASMIEHARSFNQHDDNCRYVVNTKADLACLDQERFSFIYSNITLQHIPPEASRVYLAEFVRLLAPGGIALFQIPSGPRHEPGSFSDRLYAIRKGPLRRTWKRLRRKATVEIHYVAESLVGDIIEEAGGELLESWEEGRRRGSRVRMWYLVRKPKM